MATTDYCPGVRVEEVTSSSLSVSSYATAVPVLFYSSTNVNYEFNAMQRIDSWLDFLTGCKTLPTIDSFYLAVKSYFENGGGYCYITSHSDEFDLDTVLVYDDVTLLVACGTDISSLIGKLNTDTGLFAILDAEDEDSYGTVISSGASGSEFCAYYYPWLTNDPAEYQDSSSAPHIPPSGTMAGIYCRNDRERGVWKAPANVPVYNATPLFAVTDSQQKTYTNNDNIAVNMIRTFSGQGVVVWGARTTATSEDWRYISVRRLFLSAERDIKRSMRAMVFEPNSAPTWERVRSAIDGYLNSLWRQGALLGATAKDAYYVRIGKGVTMTQDDIDQGEMIAEVGMAAVRPAEFIILRFSQDVNGS